MHCKICNSNIKKIFNARILNAYDVEYYYCSVCGFLQTEEPYWLNKAYIESINITDTGILNRNISLSKIVSVIIYYLFEPDKMFLDYAGGYGIFTRLMRDIGFDYFWQDNYTKNLFARGFEFFESKNPVEMISTIESFEHFVSPRHELDNLLTISRNVLFTTELLPESIPNPDSWWYYGLEHGQHISFYSLKTIAYIANQYKLNFYTYGSLHLLTEKKIDSKQFIHLCRISDKAFRKVKSKMKARTFDDMLYLKNINIP